MTLSRATKSMRKIQNIPGVDIRHSVMFVQKESRPFSCKTRGRPDPQQLTLKSRCGIKGNGSNGCLEKLCYLYPRTDICKCAYYFVDPDFSFLVRRLRVSKSEFSNAITEQ
jgi:hypothetical protein